MAQRTSSLGSPQSDTSGSRRGSIGPCGPRATSPSPCPRPPARKAFDQLPQRRLRILRLHDAGGEQDSNGPELERLRDVLPRLHAGRAGDPLVGVPGAEPLDGAGHDLRIRGRHAHVPADQFRRFDRDVLGRELREGLRLDDVVRARDDLEAEFAAPRNRLRHLLPRDFPLAVIDQRACRAGFQESFRGRPAGRLPGIDGVDVLAEHRDVHQLREVSEIGCRRCQDDRRTRLVGHRGETLRNFPAFLAQDFRIRLEVHNDGWDSHYAADGPSGGNRLGPHGEWTGDQRGTNDPGPPPNHLELTGSFVSAAKLDVRQASERLIARQEPNTKPTRGGVSDCVSVRELRTSGLEPHRLEQPSVLRVDDDRAEPGELSLRRDFPSVSKDREIQLDEIPDARSQLRGQIPPVPRIPSHDLDERIRVEEEPGRPHQPRRSSSFSFCGSTSQSRREPNALSIPAWSISRTTSSPALSPSSFATALGTTIPREDPHRRTLAWARGMWEECYM